MYRLLALLFACAALRASAQGDGIWYAAEPDLVTATGGSPGSRTIHIEDGSNQVWTAFPPLAAGQGVTASCRIALEKPFAPGSDIQFRWGLYRQVGGRFAGLSIFAGRTKSGGTFLRLSEAAATPTNALTMAKNRTLSDLRLSDPPPAPGSPVRLVMTVRANADGSFDVSGLFGTLAYEFRQIRMQAMPPDFSAFGLLNGRSSGVGHVTVSGFRASGGP